MCCLAETRGKIPRAFSWRSDQSLILFLHENSVYGMYPGVASSTLAVATKSEQVILVPIFMFFALKMI